MLQVSVPSSEVVEQELVAALTDWDARKISAMASTTFRMIGFGAIGHIPKTTLFYNM